MSVELYHGGAAVRGGRLHTDAGCHALDPDGACFCRDCEVAGGCCVDEDE